jgi:predicted PolB exonuclease-like 3'-5' exonuclease
MLETIKLENVLFIDVETVPLVDNFEKLDEVFKELWTKKAENIKRKTEDDAQALYKRAGIYAEFGKIVCISAGVMYKENKEHHFRVKSFYGNDEVKILTDFIELLTTHYNKRSSLLCAHNGKEFDFPYLARRIVVNGLKLPSILDLAGKKPWEINHLDTMELWKFGDYKNFTSLNLLTSILNIPSPKADMDGSDVARVFYEEKNIEKIVDYCQRDVLAVAQVFLRFRGEPIIKEAGVTIG